MDLWCIKVAPVFMGIKEQQRRESADIMRSHLSPLQSRAPARGHDP